MIYKKEDKESNTCKSCNYFESLSYGTSKGKCTAMESHVNTFVVDGNTPECRICSNQRKIKKALITEEDNVKRIKVKLVQLYGIISNVIYNFGELDGWARKELNTVYEEMQKLAGK